MRYRSLRIALWIVAVGCSRQKDAPSDPQLAPAEAERLLSEWRTAIGMGNTNCRIVFDAPTLEVRGSSVTFRGANAERCAKSFSAAKLLTTSTCKDGACDATLNEKEASAYCDSGPPCSMIFTCGSARMDDLRIVSEGRHATITFKVNQAVSLAPLDGCPAFKRSSEDGAFTARASLDDAGRWALEGRPTKQ